MKICRNTLILWNEEKSFIGKAKLFLFFLYVFVGILRATTISFNHWTSIAQTIQISILSILTFNLFFEIMEGKIKANPLVLVLILCSIINTFLTKHLFMFSFFILFSSFCNFNFKNLVKKFTYLVILSACLIVFLNIISVIPDAGASRLDKIRYSLGFKTATLPSSILMFISLGLLYVKQEKAKNWLLFLLFIINLLLFVLTDTRTGFIITILILMFWIFIKYNKTRNICNFLKRNKILRSLFIFFPFIIFGMEIILMIIYSEHNSLSFKLNNLLSTRLSLTESLFLRYPVNLFGSKISFTGEYSNLQQSDISYMFYLLNYGLFSLIFVLFGHSILIKEAINRKDIILVFIIFIIIIDGIVEPYLIDYKYQIFTFSLASFLLNKNYKIITKFERIKLMEL